MAMSTGMFATLMAVTDTLLVAYIAKVDHQSRVDRRTDVHQHAFDSTLKAVEEGRLKVSISPSAQSHLWYNYAKALIEGDAVDSVSASTKPDGIETAVIPIDVTGEANGRTVKVQLGVSLRELQLAALANNHLVGTSSHAALPDIAHWANQITVSRDTANEEAAHLAQEIVAIPHSETPQTHIMAQSAEPSATLSTLSAFRAA